MIDLSTSTDPDIAAGGVLQNGVDLDPALFTTARRWVKLSAKDLGKRLWALPIAALWG